MKRICAVLLLACLMVAPGANWGCSVGVSVGMLKGCHDGKVLGSTWSTRHQV